MLATHSLGDQSRTILACVAQLQVSSGLHTACHNYHQGQVRPITDAENIGVGLRDLKAHLSEYLRLIEKGRLVTSFNNVGSRRCWSSGWDMGSDGNPQGL